MSTPLPPTPSNPVPGGLHPAPTLRLSGDPKVAQGDARKTQFAAQRSPPRARGQSVERFWLLPDLHAVGHTFVQNDRERARHEVPQFCGVKVGRRKSEQTDGSSLTTLTATAAPPSRSTRVVATTATTRAGGARAPGGTTTASM